MFRDPEHLIRNTEALSSSFISTVFLVALSFVQGFSEHLQVKSGSMHPSRRKSFRPELLYHYIIKIHADNGKGFDNFPKHYNSSYASGFWMFLLASILIRIGYFVFIPAHKNHILFGAICARSVPVMTQCALPVEHIDL